ncbi:ABC transporter permease [Roseovarius sp. TE539]|uniref:ABC transporter permease n=1 Tax=Roseovarius sp. TE539 TaxID=2249812 RepID=UPI000DE06566|nr:ABC transporter permease [Roseovarius sp. TE539]RBI69851.1 ABC transporter permease [Roseovarius sp. TE539]
MFEFLINPAQLADVLSTALRLSIPLIFAAMGGLLCERAGVFNIALEGQILFGAFGAAVGAYYFGSPYAGLLVAIGFGMLSGLLLAILGISLRVNQIVVGIAIILFATGFTSFMSRLLFPGGGNSLTLDGFGPINIPILSDIPIVGKVLFAQNGLVYGALLLVLAINFLLFRTRAGMSIRAVGETPSAADAAGIHVFRTRYACVITGSAMAALGGAYLVLTQVLLFSDKMSAGKGFIALAAIVLGRWQPKLAFMACLLFGFFDAVQLRLQFNNPEIPFQVFAALPYLVSILALVGLMGRANPPSSIGRPYDREMR